MGNKYTVEAGSGSILMIYFGTEWFIVALWELVSTKVDGNKIHWKRLTIR